MPCGDVDFRLQHWGVDGSGTRLAITGGMSPIARAIHDRFDEVCRAELVRLRRKTASLSAADRAELDAISIAVAGAIAARLGEALDGETAPDIGNIVTRLFAVAPRDTSAEAASGRQSYVRTDRQGETL